MGTGELGDVRGEGMFGDGQMSRRGGGADDGVEGLHAASKFCLFSCGLLTGV